MFYPYPNGRTLIWVFLPASVGRSTLAGARWPLNPRPRQETLCGIFGATRSWCALILVLIKSWKDAARRLCDGGISNEAALWWGRKPEKERKEEEPSAVAQMPGWYSMGVRQARTRSPVGCTEPLLDACDGQACAARAGIAPAPTAFDLQREQMGLRRRRQPEWQLARGESAVPRYQIPLAHSPTRPGWQVSDWAAHVPPGKLRCSLYFRFILSYAGRGQFNYALACIGGRRWASPAGCGERPSQAWKFAELCKSQNHRITESQNGRGWKGPLWVI